MKTYIVLLSLVLLTTFAFSQKSSLDLKQIEKKARTNTYTELLEKFKNNDTTLTLEECQILYYGRAFQSDYNGYSSHDSIQALNKYLDNEEIDFNVVLKYTNMILEQNPVSLRYLFYTSIAYKKTGDLEMSEIFYWKYIAILQAIFSSGDGKTAKTAFVVTCIPDEYTILNVFDLEFKMQSLIQEKGKTYDLMSVGKSKLFPKGVYFNIDLFFGKLGF